MHLSSTSLLQIIQKTNYNASEVQDGNNNDLFLSFAVQHSSGIQNGCSSLINTTTTKKKSCKGFCSESKWAPTNLTNQTKSIVSCVRLINVLCMSLTPHNQIVQLKDAYYYHADTLVWGSAFWLCLFACLSWSQFYVATSSATLSKFMTYCNFQRRRRTHNWLHTLDK